MSANSAIFNPTESTSAATGDGFSVPRLTTTGRLAITFGTGDKGMMVYDTTLDNLFIWNGAAWESVPASGDAGANGSVQYNDNGVVSGAANFFWDKTNNRVGIGTATPSAFVEIYKNTNGQNRVFINNPSTGASAYSSIDLTSGTAAGQIFQLGSGYSGSYPFITGSTILQNNGLGGIVLNSFGPYPVYFGTNNVERYRIASDGVATWSNVGGVAGTAMTLNANGLGIGVTPSAWVAGAKALQFGAYGSLAQSSSGNIELSFNSYNSGAGAYKYLQTDTASLYRASSVHSWFVAPSGTAGNAITFTQAMTLDASGNLLVGKTSSSLGVVGVEARPNGEVWSTNAASTDGAGSSYILYSTGATAYRFYVGMGGTVFATNTTISAISDARLKENVQDIDVGLGAILALKPRKFDWKAGKGKDIKGDRGFIAQEFETVFPNLIDEWKDEAPEGEAPYKSVRQDLIPVLVKAIQELTARVQTLEAK
jgi:hypothetical protein